MGRALAALLGILAAGCVSTNVHRMDEALRPPRPPEAVQVLDETPDQPHTVIAHIESKAKAVFETYDDLRARMIREAAELGGHALILGSETAESQPLILATGFLIMSEEKTLEADVIVFN